MEDTEEMLKRLEAMQADPAYQEKQQRLRDARAKDVADALRAAQREIAGKLGLDERELDLVRGDSLVKTLATETLARPTMVQVLSGGPGTGKTTAAAAWIWAYVLDPENWHEVGQWAAPPKPKGIPLFVSAAELARWSRYKDEEMDRLLRPPRLVLDDLGAEYLDVKGAFQSLVDEVVNKRYANRRPTVITTNLDLEGPNGFRARYGERVADRIRGDGRFTGLGKVSMRSGAALAPFPPPKQPVLKLADRPPPPDPRLPPENDPDDISTGAP